MSFREQPLIINSESSDNSDSDTDSDSNLNKTNLDISNILISNNKFKMAPTIPELKDKYLDMIPDFYGDPALLPRFIEVSEKLVRKFYNTVDINDFQNEYLMSSILAKVKGEAAKNISSCTIRNWENLKAALLNTYADKRDIYTLSLEISALQQGNDSPFQFFNKIQQLLNLQITLLMTCSNENEQNVLGNYFRNQALRILLRGLKEPLGTLMRTKNPLDLNSALNTLTNDFQIEMGPYNNSNYSPRYKNINHNYQNNHLLRNRQNFQNNQSINWQPEMPSSSQNYQQLNRNVGLVPRNQPSTSRGPNTNVFRPNPNQKFQNPTPMSVNTSNSFRPTRNFQNRNYSQNQNSFANLRKNFISEELHNLDNTECPNENINDDFLEENASENK